MRSDASAHGKNFHWLCEMSVCVRCSFINVLIFWSWWKSRFITNSVYGRKPHSPARLRLWSDPLLRSLSSAGVTGWAGRQLLRAPQFSSLFSPLSFPPERNVVSVLECREGRISLISYKQRSCCLLWMVKGKLGEILQLHNRHIVLYGFRFQFSG